MPLFFGKSDRYTEERIERQKRMAAEENNGERKAREYKQYKELIGKGIQPSVALKTIESQRETKTVQAERYQKVYPGRKVLKTAPQPVPPKKGFLGVDWKGAGSKIASNIQTNVARGAGGFGAGYGFKQPDFGADIGFFTGAKPKRAKREPEPEVKGYDMWGRPIYGKPKKHKGKGKGRDIVIHVR